MMEMVANSLDKVYTNFDPLQPLEGDSKFYVNRKNNPLNIIKLILLEDNRNPLKLLFSGHRGSGKSTELNRLMIDEEIRRKYFIVHYSVREVLDIAGLDYTDLLISIGARIFAKSIDEKLKLKKGLLDELQKWRSVVEKEIQITDNAELGTEAGLNFFFIKALGKLKTEHINREKIRQTIEPRLSELARIINLIIAEVELKSEKKILVAIDDLDKPDLAVAKMLFYERQTSLTSPNCNIIYTVPIALLYSPEAGQVKQAFTDSYVLPNVTIMKHSDRSPAEDGRMLMKEFVLKRMSNDLIEENALEPAVTISGGVFREMVRIIRTAVINAVSRGSDKIQKEDVDTAESEIRNEFRRMLETEDYQALEEIYEKRELKGAEICAKLLHNLSILEYRNKENWCDVHPAIIPLISGVEK